MENKFTPIELEEFIKNALNQIETGVNVMERHFKGTIEFEISISKTEKTGGNVKIYVASGGKEINKESVAKIKFSVYPKIPEEKYTNLIPLPDEKKWR